MLSRIRRGKHTDFDIPSLQKLHNATVSDGCVSVFLINRLKDQYNKYELSNLPTEMYSIKASESKNGVHTRRIPVTVTKTNVHETSGISAEIQAAVNVRNMQIKNTNIANGLVN